MQFFIIKTFTINAKKINVFEENILSKLYYFIVVLFFLWISSKTDKALPKAINIVDAPSILQKSCSFNIIGAKKTLIIIVKHDVEENKIMDP